MGQKTYFAFRNIGLNLQQYMTVQSSMTPKNFYFLCENDLVKERLKESIFRSPEYNGTPDSVEDLHFEIYRSNLFTNISKI